MLKRIIALSCIMTVTHQLNAADPILSTDEIQTILAEEAKSEGFSGAIIAVKDGEIIAEHYAGYADKAERIENGPQTLFNLASSSKMFTAHMLIRELEKAGHSLDTPIKSVFSDLPFSDTVSFAHLLQHQTTIGQILFGQIPAGKREEAEDNHALFSLMMEHISEPISDSGDKTAYRNENYIIAGELLARISGNSFEDNLTALAASAGAADDISISKYGADEGQYAAPYVPADFQMGMMRRGPNSKTHKQFPKRMDSSLGRQVTSSAGGLHSKAKAPALIMMKMLEDTAALRKQCNLDTPPVGKNKLHLGYGCGGGAIDDIEASVGHGGGAPGIQTALYFYPAHNMALVVLSNHLGRAMPVRSALNKRMINRATR